MSAQMEATAVPQQHAHPGPMFYILVGIVLTALTGIEVAVYYMSALEPVLVPVLVTLSVMKFTLVVMFYMHLRFDARLFSGVFLAPLALAVTVGIALIILRRVLPY